MIELPPIDKFRDLSDRERADCMYEVMRRAVAGSPSRPMTVREFAEAKGVSPSTVYRWERDGKIHFLQTSPVRIGREELVKI